MMNNERSRIRQVIDRGGAVSFARSNAVGLTRSQKTAPEDVQSSPAGVYHPPQAPGRRCGPAPAAPSCPEVAAGPSVLCALLDVGEPQQRQDRQRAAPLLSQLIDAARHARR